MLVVLPVCEKDELAVLRNLEWVRTLDGRVDYKAIVTVEEHFNADQVEAAAKEYFSAVEVLRYNDYNGPKVWPAPSNWAWQETARGIGSRGGEESWFWWEADAIPCQRGWLKMLEEEHLAGGCPFTGFWVAEIASMNGVAIYPPNVALYAKRAFNTQTYPFDRMMAKELKGGHVHSTFIIGHYLKPKGGGVGRTFESKADVKEEWAIFHGCTDGSLIEVLAGRKTQPCAVAAPDNVAIPTKSWFDTIRGWMRKRKTRQLELPVKWTVTMPRPKVIHVVERFKAQAPDAIRRINNAWESWVRAYAEGGVIPCQVWDWPRSSKDLGDHRDLPYLRDILARGLDAGGPDDIVMLTNDDTIFTAQTIPEVVKCLAQGDCVCSFRLNFDRGAVPSYDTPAEDIKMHGSRDFGRDLFAFRKSWLSNNMTTIPDMVLGEYEWDIILAMMIREHHGIKTSRDNKAIPVPPAEMELGYVLHENHKREWIKISTSHPTKEHNHRLAEKYFKDHHLFEIVYG